MDCLIGVLIANTMTDGFSSYQITLPDFTITDNQLLMDKQCLRSREYIVRSRELNTILLISKLSK